MCLSLNLNTIVAITPSEKTKTLLSPNWTEEIFGLTAARLDLWKLQEEGRGGRSRRRLSEEIGGGDWMKRLEEIAKVN